MGAGGGQQRVSEGGGQPWDSGSDPLGFRTWAVGSDSLQPLPLGPQRLRSKTKPNQKEPGKCRTGIQDRGLLGVSSRRQGSERPAGRVLQWRPPSGPGGSAKLLETRDLNCMQGCGLQHSWSGREGSRKSKAREEGGPDLEGPWVQAGSGALFRRKAKGLLIGVCWGLSSLLPGG